MAAQLLPDGDGVIRGREALRAYWSHGLRLLPDLHFTVEGVYAGLDTIAIEYRNHTGNSVCEALRFDGPLVAVATPCSSATMPRPASGLPIAAAGPSDLRHHGHTIRDPPPAVAADCCSAARSDRSSATAPRDRRVGCRASGHASRSVFRRERAVCERGWALVGRRDLRAARPRAS